jgi:hypothetical protein
VAENNWEHLIHAVLKRDQDQHHTDATMSGSAMGLGLASTMSASLDRTTNIE